MIIEYENKTVENIFNNADLLRKKLGSMARTAKKRLDQLTAADNFSIYLETRLGNPHSLSGNLKGSYGVTLSGNLRLIVKPDAKSLDPKDLKDCDTVIIRGVRDYHEKKNKWLIP